MSNPQCIAQMLDMSVGFARNKFDHNWLFAQDSEQGAGRREPGAGRREQRELLTQFRRPALFAAKDSDK